MAAGDVPEWTLGDRLRKAREVAGIRQDEIAERLGVSPATISNWETGTRHARGGEINMVGRWARETRVSEAWLLGLVQPT
jgi:transcriptional regulator with XRE-family HTH domain